MSKLLIPILLLIASGTIFFAFIDEQYQQIKELQREEALFNDALENAKELQAVRDDLLAEYNSFPLSDLSRLEKLVPDNVDNVRLIRDINGIAEAYDMSVQNVDFAIANDGSGTLGGSQNQIGTATLSFSVVGTYDTFLAFLTDLEQSLRLLDVVNVNFSSGLENQYTFAITVKTYWLQ